MKIKRSILAVALFLMLGCASSRLKVMQLADFDFQDFTSFQIAPLSIGQTQASADPIVAKSGTLNRKLAEAMLTKGYNNVNAENPDFSIGLRLTALSESILADPNLDFMKGVHGSNFPLANPRARSYNADVLVLEVKQKLTETPVMTAACRLEVHEKVDLVARPIRVPQPEISYSEVESCLVKLLAVVPSSKTHSQADHK